MTCMCACVPKLENAPQKVNMNMNTNLITKWHLWAFIQDMINARRMRTRVKVLSLSVCRSVCVLPNYWLHKRFIQLTEHTNRFHANIRRFSTKGFLWNASFPELQLHPIYLACQGGHFVLLLKSHAERAWPARRSMYWMRMLTCHVHKQVKIVAVHNYIDYYYRRLAS